MHKLKLTTDVVGATKLADRLGYPVIVRSDGPEDRMGASFAGLFLSKVAHNEQEFFEVVHLVRSGNDPYLGILDDPLAFTRVRYDRNRDIMQYVNSRGVPVPKVPIDVIIQKYSPAKMRAILTRHPHMDNAIHVDLEWHIHHTGNERIGAVVVNGNIRELMNEYHDLCNNPENPRSPKEKECYDLQQIAEQLRLALKHYAEIECLPEFKNRGIAHQEEALLLPYSVVQWRPFRKIEAAEFKLENVVPRKSKHGYDASLVFGITPKEGIAIYHMPCDGPPTKIAPKICEMGVDMLMDKFREAFEAGVPTALSFWNIGIYGSVLDRKLVQTPKLAIFNGDRKYYAWQAHETFRFLERGSLVALANGAPYEKMFGKNMRYWSDGINGRIQFLG